MKRILASLSIILGVIGLAQGIAHATHPVISTAKACVDGHTVATVTVEPVPGHTFTKGNTWGAIVEDFTEVPHKLGKTLGLGSYTLHVQVVVDNGSFVSDFPIEVTPLGDCETPEVVSLPPSSSSSVAPTTTTLAPTTTTTRQVVESVVPTSPTFAPTTSSTAVGDETAIDVPASVTGSVITLPRTGANRPIWDPRQPSHLLAYLLLLIGGGLLIVGRRRPATI